MLNQGLRTNGDSVRLKHTFLAHVETELKLAYILKKEKDQMFLTFNLQLSPTSGLIRLIQASLKCTTSLEKVQSDRTGLKSVTFSIVVHFVIKHTFSVELGP